VPYTCQAVFLTEGEGRAESFRLVLVRLGKGYEAVNSYNLEISIQPDDPTLPTFLNRWLELVRDQLLKDLS
jgi:hypothetical protein